MKSKLVLGTAQLGMNYGIGNVHGAPTKDEAFAILDEAYAGDINTFDTSSDYGVAEEVLGEWIVARGIAGEIHIISKMNSTIAEGVPDQIKTSLRRLRLSHLDGYLLHTPQHLYDEQVMADLQEVKESGLTRHIGVSVYEPADALYALTCGVDYIQMPYNAFDQRLDRTDFLARAKERGTEVFTRSPFLQGLLLMSPESVPPYLVSARPHLEHFIVIATRHQLSPLEAALIFALHLHADHVIFGAETILQLQDILHIAHQAESPHEDFIREIKHAFQDVDTNIVDPSLWRK